MKSIIGIACLCLFISLGSCKKCQDSDAKIPTSANDIAGTWELRKTSGGMMPGFRSYPDGNGNLIKFKDGGIYEIYEKSLLKLTGSYTVVADTAFEASVCLVAIKDQYQNRVVFDGNNNRKAFFQLFNNNKLVFYEGCYALDAGHSEEYERK